MGVNDLSLRFCPSEKHISLSKVLKSYGWDGFVTRETYIANTMTIIHQFHLAGSSGLLKLPTAGSTVLWRAADYSKHTQTVSKSKGKLSFQPCSIRWWTEAFVWALYITLDNDCIVIQCRMLWRIKDRHTSLTKGLILCWWWLRCVLDNKPECAFCFQEQRCCLC